MNFIYILTLAVFFAAGCNQGKEEADGTASSFDKHWDSVSKFQDGQKRFKVLVSKVRDEKSFDAAKPKLDIVVSDWREVATELGKLEPPSEEQQAKFRELIAEGVRATEPTNEDMLSLILIESREAEVTQWLEEFAAAVGAVGIELGRLYGPADYAKPEVELPRLDLSQATVNGVPIDQWMNDPAQSLQLNQEAEQDGARRPATAPDSKSEGKEKLKPESEGRSQ